MKKGYIVEEVCAELDIARDTFFCWVSEHEEFSDAYKKGRTAFNAFAARMYRNAMLGVPITKEG
ncbi:MAG: hypothetical protein LBD31_08565, partial [Treponema sp.]|nr:hypothetical protein [Treponema sp.]